MEDILLKNSDRIVLRKLEHTYDEVDNITEIVETRASAVTKTFGYDDLDQLISEDWSTGYTADYEYDANGNRTKRTVGTTVEDYFYDDSDKLTEIKIGGTVTKSFDYDTNGRRTEMTDGGGTTYYGYDMGDRLTSITRSGLTTNSFSYNGFDTRVSKTDSAGTTSYKRAGAGVTSSLLRSTVSSTSTDYTPGISSRVSSTLTFMHSGLKNSDEQSGSGGTISASLQYDAFGKQVSSSGTWVGAFKYGGAYGYQTDPDHGLKLLGHRYYEADTGRFLTRDPIKDGRNWYGYCGNSPVSYADPLGTELLFVNDKAKLYKPAIIDALTIIGGSPVGAPIVEDLLYGPKKYLLVVESGIVSKVDTRGGLNTLLLKEDDFFYVDYLDTDGIYQPFTLEQVLMHELTHLVKGISGQDNEERVVQSFENAFLDFLGRPRRKSYDLIRIRKPTERGKGGL
ncbi:MAG: hypothetical protein K1X67_03410 [Fimbriimonadaceae bacterium]|nr:hypothetical protein [Fimbriimonadaceae bacterium]